MFELLVQDYVGVYGDKLTVLVLKVFFRKHLRRASYKAVSGLTASPPSGI